MTHEKSQAQFIRKQQSKIGDKISGKEETSPGQTVVETPTKHLLDDPEASGVVVHDQNLQSLRELAGDDLFTAEDITNGGGRTKDSLTRRRRRRGVATPSRGYTRLRHSLQSLHGRKTRRAPPTTTTTTKSPNYHQRGRNDQKASPFQGRIELRSAQQNLATRTRQRLKKSREKITAFRADLRENRRK